MLGSSKLHRCGDEERCMLSFAGFSCVHVLFVSYGPLHGVAVCRKRLGGSQHGLICLRFSSLHIQEDPGYIILQLILARTSRQVSDMFVQNTEPVENGANLLAAVEQNVRCSCRGYWRWEKLTLDFSSIVAYQTCDLAPTWHFGPKRPPKDSVPSGEHVSDDASTK